MMNNLIAAKYNINSDTIHDLRQMCIRDVASIGGKYCLKDAIDFQRSDQ